MKDFISLPPSLPNDVFSCIEAARKVGRRVVPLFGAGVSVDAGIPTSALLSDYIVTVCGIARQKGWRDYRAYLRKFQWPHRHDVWSHWLAAQPRAEVCTLSSGFADLRNKLYRESIAEEFRRVSPLYSRIAHKHFNQLQADNAQYTDYRSLLSTVTSDDVNLIDAFFDHFVRGRRPSTTHQFIAFMAQLLRIDLVLTTNFDSLIETALRDEGLHPTVYEVNREGSVPSSILVRNQSLSVVKLHGGTHSLRTGYDLDDRLPISALEEIRSYLTSASPLYAPGDDAALILVLGYGGNDRRVMDIITDHLSDWRPGDTPRVIWVSRDGTAPSLLVDAVQSASQALSPSIKQDKPALLCEYKSGQLFLQHLYQVLEHQHAVSRTHYRAVVSVPRYPVIKTVAPAEKPNQNHNRFRVYWAIKEGSGTSAALQHAAYENLGHPHEVIWVDASDFTTRAALVAQIQEEFARLDRGCDRITRPLLLRDVDYFKCRLDSEAPSSRAEGSFLDREDAWEAEVAVRWIIGALRRGNYVLAIDSLGEFARPHPALSLTDHSDESQLDRQRARLRNFLGMLASRSEEFGQSVIMVAMTPMTTRAVTSDVVDDQMAEFAAVYDQLAEITGRRLHTCGIRVDAPHAGEQQPRSSRHVEAVGRFKGFFGGDTEQQAAGIMLALASLFRRPRSRTALLVTFVRFVELGSKSDCGVSAELNAMLADIQKMGKTKGGNLIVAEEALALLEERGRFGKDGQWRLLSLLEAGFYWMHLETRDEIFNASTGTVAYTPKDSDRPISLTIFSEKLLAHVFDEIALFAINDVYERSHDVSAFIEYVHYRFLSIRFFARQTSAPYIVIWQDRLEWLIGAIDGESETLRARGKLAALIEQLRQVIELIVSLDQLQDPKGRQLLRPLATRLFARHSDLLLASGHPRDAIVYRLWQKEIISNTLGTLEPFREQAKDLLQFYLDGGRSQQNPTTALCARVRKDASNALASPGIDGLSEVEASIELARLLVDPVLLSSELLATDTLRKLIDSEGWNRDDAMQRRKTATDILNNCHVRLHELLRETGFGRDSQIRVRESIALVVARQRHDELNEVISSIRFGWLFPDAAPSASLFADERLKEIERKCLAAMDHLRKGPATARGQRTESYLLTLRAVSLYHYGNEFLKADVKFKRAQAVLCRPAAPGEKLASAVALLTEAECALIHARILIPLIASKAAKIPDRMNRTQADNPGVLFRELRQTAITRLNQAEPLLAEGRADNRWRTYFDYLSALWHLTCFQFNRSIWSDTAECNGRDLSDALSPDEVANYLSDALRHVVSGLTNSGKFTDQAIVLRLLFKKIEALGQQPKNSFGVDGWMIQRLRCGLPESRLKPEPFLDGADPKPRDHLPLPDLASAPLDPQAGSATSPSSQRVKSNVSELAPIPTKRRSKKSGRAKRKRAPKRS